MDDSHNACRRTGRFKCIEDTTSFSGTVLCAQHGAVLQAFQLEHSQPLHLDRLATEEPDHLRARAISPDLIDEPVVVDE